LALLTFILCGSYCCFLKKNIILPLEYGKGRRFKAAKVDKLNDLIEKKYCGIKHFGTIIVIDENADNSE